MIAETVKLLSDGLGPDNFLAAGATALLARFGPSGAKAVESCLAAAAWGFSTWAALWAPYAKDRRPSPQQSQQGARRAAPASGYVEWLAPRAGTVLTWYMVATAASFLVFLSPLVPHFVGWAIALFVFDGKSHAGLKFLFAYDDGSPVYGVYKTATWVLAVALGTAATVFFAFHHAFRGSPVRYGWNEAFDFGKAWKRAAAAFAVCMVVFFTTVPEGLANWALGIFSDRTVESLVRAGTGTGSSK